MSNISSNSKTTREMKDSGIEWIGVIPKEWDSKKIKHFIKFSEKSNILASEGGIEGQYPFYTSSIVLNKRINKAIYCGPKIIMGTGGKASVHYSSIDFSTSTDCLVFESKKQLLSKYLFYNISKSLNEFNDLGFKGTALKHLELHFLLNFETPLPPLHEQQAIANYLDEKVGKIDELIAEQNQAIENWKAYKQSLITETVTKGLNPNAEMKDSGIEWIGEIPSAWEISKMSKQCDIYGRIGFRGYTVEDIVSEGEGAITLGPSNIKENQLNLENKTFLSFEKYEESPEIKIYNGDVVLVKTASVGKVAIIKGLKEECTLNPQLVVLKNIKCNNRYLYYLIASPVVQNQILSGIQSNVVATITQTQLKNYIVIIPSLYEQQQIADYLDKKCSKIDQTIEQKQVLIKQLEEYKQSLIYECVTGKRCVL